MSAHIGRPPEQEAVRTTIVGGRPPGSGKAIGNIPRGIEILVKKASLDPAFGSLLIEKRAAAAETIGLRLEPAEAMMLRAVPPAQLRTIISRARVEPHQRAAFLGYAAAVMLAALTATAFGCERNSPTDGIRPDDPGASRPPATASSTAAAPTEGTTTTISPVATVAPTTVPRPPVSRGIVPDRPPVSKGIRPDRPQETNP